VTVPKGIARGIMDFIPWLIAAYLAICAAAYFGHRTFMYFPDPARVAPADADLEGAQEIEFAAKDGTRLVAWYGPAKQDKPTILYFHGNAANAANRAPKIAVMLEDGFGVFYLNNRGYGGSGGSPTEANNVADAIAAYDELRRLGVPADRIAAYGESLARAKRCGSRRSARLPVSYSKRRSLRRSTWRARSISGCRSGS
jgi:fermentation-respiration switch protein FrsA (DUF1100 family)